MATGLGLLGIPPHDFWAMTPRELAAAIRGRLGTAAQPQPLVRRDLDDLMHRFPDDSKRDHRAR